MKKTFFLIVLGSCLFSCKESGGNDSESQENPIVAASNFIRAALDGDYDKAKKFMMNDSLNQEELSTTQRLNERLSPDEKKRYREATIRIHETRNLNDSTSVIYYSNSYRNKTDSLRVIKKEDKWMVDFKFIFHKHDTIQ
jgi:Domain of unknown function (DUF4878)